MFFNHAADAPRRADSDHVTHNHRQQRTKKDHARWISRREARHHRDCERAQRKRGGDDFDLIPHDCITTWAAGAIQTRRTKVRSTNRESIGPTGLSTRTTRIQAAHTRDMKPNIARAEPLVSRYRPDADEAPMNLPKATKINPFIPFPVRERTPGSKTPQLTSHCGFAERQKTGKVNASVHSSFRHQNILRLGVETNGV